MLDSLILLLVAAAVAGVVYRLYRMARRARRRRGSAERRAHALRLRYGEHARARVLQQIRRARSRREKKFCRGVLRALKRTPVRPTGYRPPASSPEEVDDFVIEEPPRRVLALENLYFATAALLAGLAAFLMLFRS